MFAYIECDLSSTSIRNATVDPRIKVEVAVLLYRMCSLFSYVECDLFSTSIRNATVDPLIEVEVALFHVKFY